MKANLLLSVAAGLCAAGCGGSGHHSPISPLPPGTTPSTTSAYIGSQDPGYWSLTVDDVQKAFSYQALTYPQTARSGNFAVADGILDLGNVAGVSLGQAVEQTGSAALLRPGDNTAFPVAMIQKSDCFAINGKLRYIYAALPGQGVQQSGNTTNTGYGTFVVSTSSDGKSWNFDDLHNYVLTEFEGGPFAAGTENGHDPASFSAMCASQNGEATITADPKALFSLPPTFRFHPAGGFLEDRSPSDVPSSPSSYGWVGFAMPSAAVKPADVASGSYRGFVYESTDVTPVHTRAVAFAQATDFSPVLVGGAYPNDDLGQKPGGEYTITLGKQDSALNGVFPNATFTAFDTYGSCAAVSQQIPSVQIGFDANGNAICTALGVAIASQIDGKYVLYFTSNDGTPDPVSSTATRAYVIQFYLYQQ